MNVLPSTDEEELLNEKTDAMRKTNIPVTVDDSNIEIIKASPFSLKNLSEEELKKLLEYIENF